MSAIRRDQLHHRIARLTAELVAAHQELATLDGVPVAPAATAIVPNVSAAAAADLPTEAPAVWFRNNTLIPVGELRKHPELRTRRTDSAVGEGKPKRRPFYSTRAVRERWPEWWVNPKTSERPGVPPKRARACPSVP